MIARVSRALAALVVVLALPFACSKDATKPPDTKCDPGTAVFCRCPDGEAGSRECNADGQTFTDCVLQDTGEPCPASMATSTSTSTSSAASSSGGGAGPSSSSASSSSSGAGGSGGSTSFGCPGAPVSVSLASDTTVLGDTSLATDAYVGLCGGSGSPEVVYEVTPQSSGTLTATVNGATLDAVLYATTQPCGSGISLGCADATGPAGDETLTLEGVSGKPFYLFVDGKSGSAGAFSLHLHMAAGVPGDTCAGVPISLGLGAKITAGGDTSIAAANYKGTGACAAGMSTKDIVYAVTPMSDGTLTITVTPDVGFDPVLYARTGSCTTGTEIGCANAAGPGAPEVLTLPATNGSKVSVIVDGANTSAGGYTIELSLQ